MSQDVARRPARVAVQPVDDGLHAEAAHLRGVPARPAPHRHNPDAFGRLRSRVVDAFRQAGASADMAEQSWYVFGLAVVVQRLAAQQADLDLGPCAPRFDLFLDTLLRGLPARERNPQRNIGSAMYEPWRGAGGTKKIADPTWVMYSLRASDAPSLACSASKCAGSFW